MIERPLPDLAAWTRHLRDAEIPVLPGTAAELDMLREMEEHSGCVDAHTLADSIEGDPLMTLRVLSHVARHRPASRVTDPETVTAAIVMMGVAPFFKAFGGVPTVEQHLRERPAALDGLLGVMRRAHRASRFALAFAVHRMDGDAPVVRNAALLHDFAEMLLWCHAPALAQEIAARQEADPTLRSAEVQRAVLNVNLAELEQSLMRAWRLPELLVRITNDQATGRAAEDPQVRTVKLAVQLARHSQSGWNNAAIPDDTREIAALLNLSLEATARKVREVDEA